MSDGLKRAFAATARTRLNDEDFKFLRELAKWDGVASPQDLGPQWRSGQNPARQKCKRNKLVTYEGGYWRMTDLGRLVLSPPAPGRE
jgi:hypothetical protein